MASVVSFESRLAQLCADVLALRAQAEDLSVYVWSSANGAGYEGIYNDGALGPDDPPVGGAVTQNQANNAISALNSVEAAIATASAALATLREFDPDLLA